MKFLCVECDRQMEFAQLREPGDGTFAARFTCPECGRSVALLANPMETQLVGSLGVKIGGAPLDDRPMEFVREHVEGGALALSAENGPQGASDNGATRGPVWSEDALERLERVPVFVRGMVKRVYLDYASQRGIGEITPDVMDRARAELGLEGM
ncbi:MAG: PCP reductase family protein [Gemmatimonadales bacterium]